MKKAICLVVCWSLNVLAAASSSDAEQFDMKTPRYYTYTCDHSEEGMSILFRTKYSLPQKQGGAFVHAFSKGLALLLNSGMDAGSAKRQIKEFIEKNVAESEASSGAIGKAHVDGEAVHMPAAVELSVNLEESKVKLVLIGKAVPGKCCAFLSPYTITEAEYTPSIFKQLLKEWHCAEARN